MDTKPITLSFGLKTLEAAEDVQTASRSLIGLLAHCTEHTGERYACVLWKCYEGDYEETQELEVWDLETGRSHVTTLEDDSFYRCSGAAIHGNILVRQALGNEVNLLDISKAQAKLVRQLFYPQEHVDEETPEFRIWAINDDWVVGGGWDGQLERVAWSRHTGEVVAQNVTLDAKHPMLLKGSLLFHGGMYWLEVFDLSTKTVLHKVAIPGDVMQVGFTDETETELAVYWQTAHGPSLLTTLMCSLYTVGVWDKPTATFLVAPKEGEPFLKPCCESWHQPVCVGDEVVASKALNSGDGLTLFDPCSRRSVFVPTSELFGITDGKTTGCIQCCGTAGKLMVVEEDPPHRIRVFSVPRC